MDENLLTEEESNTRIWVCPFGDARIFLYSAMHRIRAGNRDTPMDVFIKHVRKPGISRDVYRWNAWLENEKPSTPFSEAEMDTPDNVLMKVHRETL